MIDDTRMYSSREVAAMADVNFRTLDFWLQRGVVTSTIPARGTGSERRFTFADALIVAAVAALPTKDLATRKEIASALRVSALNADVFEIKLSPLLTVFIALGRLRAAIAQGGRLPDAGGND